MLSRSIAAVSICLLTGAAVQAQQPAPLQLRETFREPFSLVRGIAELSDGRVLIADQREMSVFAADFRTGQRKRIGTGEGAGPHEYKAPIGLFHLSADTVAIYDLQNNRFQLVSRDSIVGTRLLGSGGVVSMVPRAVDRSGTYYWDKVSAVRLEKRTNPNASAAAILKQRPDGEEMSIGTLTIPGGINPAPFPDWDFWDAAPDGWVAVVRNQGEYRVDWIDPRGAQVRGPLVDEKRLEITRADRQTFDKQVESGERRVSQGLVQQQGQAPPPRPKVPDLPEFFPYAVKVWASPAGHAWVQRQLPLAKKSLALDVFDRAGRRVARYQIAGDRKLIGFGASSVYVLRTDNDGLQWLERYAYPR